jgi:hypothetical protein
MLVCAPLAPAQCCAADGVKTGGGERLAATTALIMAAPWSVNGQRPLHGAMMQTAPLLLSGDGPAIAHDPWAAVAATLGACAATLRTPS